MSPAGHTHGKVAARFAARLLQFVEAQSPGEVYAAETGLLLATSPDTVRAPDVEFVAAARLAELQAASEVSSLDLAVEVISLSSPLTVRRWPRRDFSGSEAIRRHAYQPSAEVHPLFRHQVAGTPDLLPGWTCDSASAEEDTSGLRAAPAKGMLDVSRCGRKGLSG